MGELSPAVKQIVLEKGINLMVQTGAITIPGISPKQEVKVEWKRKKTRKNRRTAYRRIGNGETPSAVTAA